MDRPLAQLSGIEVSISNMLLQEQMQAAASKAILVFLGQLQSAIRVREVDRCPLLAIIRSWWMELLEHRPGQLMPQWKLPRIGPGRLRILAEPAADHHRCMPCVRP